MRCLTPLPLPSSPPLLLSLPHSPRGKATRSQSSYSKRSLAPQHPESQGLSTRPYTAGYTQRTFQKANKHQFVCLYLITCKSETSSRLSGLFSIIDSEGLATSCEPLRPLNRDLGEWALLSVILEWGSTGGGWHLPKGPWVGEGRGRGLTAEGPAALGFAGLLAEGSVQLRRAGWDKSQLVRWGPKFFMCRRHP